MSRHPSTPSPSRARVALLAALLVVAASGCSSSGPKIDPEVTRQIHVRAALDHYDLGDMDRAIDQAQRALTFDEEDRTMQLLIGWCHLRKGTTRDLLEAERIFVGLEKKYPDERRATLGAAKVTERLGLVHRQSADDIESGRSLPVARDPEAEVERLRSEAERLFAAAETRYRTLIDSEAENLEALNGLVRVTGLTGRPEESLTHVAALVKALEEQRAFYAQQLKNRVLDPADENSLRNFERTSVRLLVDAHQLAAELHHQLGRASLALGHLDLAVGLEPIRRPELYAQRAQMNLEVGNPGRALEDLDMFIARSSLPVDHPDVQRAWQLRRDAREALAATGPEVGDADR
jgi:tetratricopeptide (TPR) repeat protein